MIDFHRAAMLKKLMKISELINLSPKDTVPCVRGQLVEMFPRKVDPKGGSAQTVTIQDDTGKVRVVLDGVPELPASLKGREVMFSSVDGKGGLTWVEEPYKDKIYQMLHLTATGVVELLDKKTTPPKESAQPATAMAPPASAKPQGATTTPPAPSMPPKGNGGPVQANGKKVDERLAQFSRLYLRCLDAAVYVQKQYQANHKVEMSGEQFQACASSLFIQATKDSLYLNL
jgi:hypothetical protein